MTIPGIEIRAESPADVDAVKEVWRLAVADLRKFYRPTASAIKTAGARQGVGSLVALIDGRVVGGLRYYMADGRLRSMGPMVHPDFRRRGVARALLGALAEIGRELGASCLALCTVVQTGNVEIFRRLGFKVVSEYPATDMESITGQPLTEAEMERPI
ncbi:MAG: GNAT family N-acetyltransferase [Phycisphaerae bacterium]